MVIKRLPQTCLSVIAGIGVSIGLTLGSGGCLVAIARPVPDDTLGSDRSDIQQIRANQFRIEGGARRGSNLFHSFQDFDVPDGVAVYFANPASIETILSRVTGNSSSEILGTLGVDGMANLFLINPNGIVFGPNARLDIRGSFVASTADRFTFPDGSQFSASAPQAAPLLTVNVPIGLQYGTGMGAIANAGTLQVGRDLTLSAQQLDLQGQLQAGRHLTLVADDLRIRDRVITPFIATAGQTMRLQGNQQLDIVALNHPDSRLVAGSDLILRSPNPVIGDAHYWSGGDFRVERADGILGDFWSPIDPIIRAGGDVAFDTYRGTSLHIFAGGAVDIGSVVITGTDAAAVEDIDAIAETVTLSDGITTVAIDGRTQPTLDIRAGVNLEAIAPPIGVSGSVEELTPADPLSPTRTSADITLDSVNLEAPNGLVFLTNQYQADPTLPGGTIEVDSIRTDDSLNGFAGNGGTVIVDAREGLNVGDRIDASSGTGNAGNIHLLAGGLIALDRSFLISNTTGIGRGGDITLQTGSFAATNGAQIQANTDGLANAGRITITAQDTVSFDGAIGRRADQRTGIENRILAAPAELRNPAITSGGIVITTGSLFITQGAQLQVRLENNAQGLSGNVNVDARNAVVVDGVSPNTIPSAASSAIITSIEKDGTGRAGDIVIRAETVELTNGGQLQSNTRGQGNSGSVMVTADDRVLIEGERRNRSSVILSRVNGNGTGDGGDIRIEAPVVDILDDAEIRTGAEGRGNGGSIAIIAPVRALFQDDVLIQSSVLGRGANAGDIRIEAGTFDLIDDGVIEAITEGQGTGGTVSIIADGVARFQDNVRVRTTLEDPGVGRAGDILIEAASVIAEDEARIEARTRSQGDGGNITIRVPGTIALSDSVTVVSSLERGGTGNSGNIRLEAEEISIQRSSLQSNTIDEGNAGTITLIAGDRVHLDEGPVSILSRVNPNGNGNGGDVLIDTGTLEITNGAGILSRTEGMGDAGNVQIIARDQVLIDGRNREDNSQCNRVCLSGVFSSVNLGAVGNGGQIDIQTESLTISNEGRLDASTAGTGEAGGVDILAQQVDVVDQGEISTSTFGAFDAGEIEIIADSLLLARDGIVSSGVLVGASGSGGNIVLDVSDLTLRRGGRVETRTQGFIPSRLASQVADDSYTDLVQADDPAAYWPLDDAAGETTVADRGGDRFDGTIEGTVLLGQPGVSGTGAALDGNEGAINVGQVETESALGFAERSFTVEAWVNPNADPPDQQVFFGVHDENDRRESLHLRLNDDGSIRVGFFADDLDTPEDTLRFGDEWYHVVTRYDQPTDTTSVFVNGTLVDVGGDGPYEGENPIVRIGNWRSPTDQTFDGSIDEVAVYNMPLSLERIAARYFRGQQNLGNALDFQPNQDANAGNIRVNADSITISGISPTGDRSSGLLSGTEGQASGQGGNITVMTDRLRVSDGGVLSARTLNSSSGGAIAIDANTLTLTDGGQILTTALASGDAGQISVTSDRIRLSGEAQSISSENEGTTSLISARTQGAGNAGSIEVNGNQLILQNQAELSASTSGAGRGGDIDLNVQELTVRGGGRVSASTSGNGRGGAIQIQGAELVRLQGAMADGQSSGIFTTTEAGAGDRGGRIFIDAQDLQILDQAVISARTRSPFRGGSVRIASDTVELSNGGQIVTTASNRGAAGDIRIDVRDAIQILGQAAIATTDTDGVASGLFASTQQDGDAGNIIVSADQFDAIAGGRIATSTAGGGDAGDINLFVSDRVTLSDSQSGLFADTAQGSSGDGGSILVDPQTVRIQNGAGIAVSSRGRGVGGNITVQGEAIFLDNGGFISADNDGISQGGDIQIQGDRLFLDNRSFISAETASSQGGNVDLSFDDVVVLRRGSSISTDAGTSRRADANGDGGNISIATGFVVAVPSENSDISANATRGNGGSVGITAQGIFGIQFRDEESPLSDITVSSEFGTDGIVVIDTLDVDPSRGLTDLPSEPVDPQLNQSCQPQGDASTGRFVDAGRGGLPPTPGDTAIGQTWDDVRSPDVVDEVGEETGDRTVQSSSSTATSLEIPSEIEEAQGWTVDADGRVILTADASRVTPYSSWQTPTQCGQ